MKINNYQHHSSKEQATGKKKKFVILLNMNIVILVLICLCFYSGRRAMDEPRIQPTLDRTYETDWQNPIKDKMIPIQENQRLKRIISDCYWISDEGPCFYIQFPEENFFYVTFTLKDVAGNELYQLDYVTLYTNVTVFLELDFEIVIYPCFAICGVCFAFSRIKQDRLPLEKVRLKKLQIYFYKNSDRVRKIENSCAVMLNLKYDQRKGIDNRNKQLKKFMKWEEKKNLKKSKFRRIE